MKDIEKRLEEFRKEYKFWGEDDKDYQMEECKHIYPLNLYIPAGQSATLPCPYCGKLYTIRSSGAMC